MYNDTTNLRLTPYSSIQNAVAMPDKIYPVFIGSGKLVMGLDVTGLQGANNIEQYYYNEKPCQDLYVVGNGMISNAIHENNTHPYGYLSYQIEFNGKVFDSLALLKHGTMFSRHNDIKKGKVVTTFLLDNKLFVEITTIILKNTKKILLRYRFKSYCQFTVENNDIYDVKLTVNFNLKKRNDELLYDEISGNNPLNVTVNGYEKYKYSLAVIGGEASFKNNSLSTTYKLKAAKNWTNLYDVVYSFDNDNSFDIEERVNQHYQMWDDYYNKCAKMNSKNVEEEFIYNNSLYMFEYAFEIEKYGIDIGHPFYFVWCWNQCVFWDMHYIVDAMLDSNNTSAARDSLKFLLKHMRKEGKPFPWMFIYDGHTFLDEKRDIAPLVIAAHAMSAIKYYETTLNKEELEDLCYPIISRCANFAVEVMFTKNEFGKYIISLPVSNDVVEEEGSEINQTFTTVWFLTIIAKAIEYAKVLNKPYNPIFDEIINNYYIEHDENEYYHSKGMKASDHIWASWIPFINYPTEGMPFLDESLVMKTREKYNYIDLYEEKQNAYQPWTECIEAQASLRTKEYEIADNFKEYAIKYHVFGEGYFAECGPKKCSITHAPYVSAHGSYTSFVLNRFVMGSIWNNELSLFVGLPTYMLHKELNVENVNTYKGVKVLIGKYTPTTFYCKLSNTIDNKVTVRYPVNANGAFLYVDNERIDYHFDAKHGTITFELKAGLHTIEIY